MKGLAAIIAVGICGYYVGFHDAKYGLMQIMLDAVKEYPSGTGESK